MPGINAVYEDIALAPYDMVAGKTLDALEKPSPSKMSRDLLTGESIHDEIAFTNLGFPVDPYQVIR